MKKSKVTTIINKYEDTGKVKYLDCTCCFERKGITMFHKKKGGYEGRNSKCKQCVSEYNRKRNSTEAQSKKNTENALKWKAENKEKAMKIQVKANAKYRESEKQRLKEHNEYCEKIAERRREKLSKETLKRQKAEMEFFLSGTPLDHIGKGYIPNAYNPKDRMYRK
jgi:hypothetical protein